MNGISVVCRSAPDGVSVPNRTPADRAGRPRLRRLAAVVTPLIVTVVTAAPAFAWPEMGY